jgi:hypothetical protein
MPSLAGMKRGGVLTPATGLLLLGNNTALTMFAHLFPRDVQGLVLVDAPSRARLPDSSRAYQFDHVGRRGVDHFACGAGRGVFVAFPGRGEPCRGCCPREDGIEHQREDLLHCSARLPPARDSGAVWPSLGWSAAGSDYWSGWENTDSRDRAECVLHLRCILINGHGRHSRTTSPRSASTSPCRF